MSIPAPQLLVSVRNATEAMEALAGGADWIDLKEPRRGALGPVDAATARDVVEVVASRAPISAAASELRDWPDAGTELLRVEGVSLIKLGLAGSARSSVWREAWRLTRDRIVTAGKQMVAVVYADAAAADAPPAQDVLEFAAELNCPWALWDTFDKSGDSLTSYVERTELAAQLTAARQYEMKTVVAGRLNLATLPLLPWGVIDMIAVRGAACRGSRDSAVCRERVAKLRDALVVKAQLVHARG